MHRRDLSEKSDTITKSIIDLWPRICWCYMHWWRPMRFNVVFEMDKLWLAQKSVPDLKVQGRDPLVKTWWLSWGVMSKTHTRSLPLIMSKSRIEESPDSLKHFGSRAWSLHGGEPDQGHCPPNMITLDWHLMPCNDCLCLSNCLNVAKHFVLFI